MPYDKSNFPEAIKGLPTHAKDIWIATFNSAYKEYEKDESRSHATAWAAVKRAGYSQSKEGTWSKMENEICASSLDKDKEITMGHMESKKKRKVKKMSKFAKWTTAYKNSLPDSSFAIIMGEGDNKVRKLPFKNAEGKVDLPHLRNALARVAQSKTELGDKRGKVMSLLQGYAKKYLSSNQTTKSGAIMAKYISKFEDENKPVVDETQSKFKELIDLCEEYKSELSKHHDEISKMTDDQNKLIAKNSELAIHAKAQDETISKLSTQILALGVQISKFHETAHLRIVDAVAEKVSKFKGYNTQQTLELKQAYITSKMSDSALEEIGRKTEEQIYSKLSEPKALTKSSILLDESQEEVSKMSEADMAKLSPMERLAVLANANAKLRGFRS